MARGAHLNRFNGFCFYQLSKGIEAGTAVRGQMPDERRSREPFGGLSQMRPEGTADGADTTRIVMKHPIQASFTAVFRFPRYGQPLDCKAL
jgi:hypothetical protein